MSTISKYNSPLKKNGKQETSIDEIQNPTGIAIFRGYEENVTVEIMQVQQSAAPLLQVNSEEPPTQEKIEEIITDSSLLPEEKDKTTDTFRNGLVTELNKGDQANTMTIMKQLDFMRTLLPDIREPLRLFIDNYTDVSKAVKVLSHKLLD